MASEFTDGDPGRSIALLWGLAETGRRGPKPRHSVEDVVRAAISLADAAGLEALSMRRVAETLQLSPMSLYTYVPSKAVLTDLMLDRVADEVTAPVGGDWRSRLTGLCRERWALAQRHPWIMRVGARRPALGPKVLANVEATLSALDGLDLSPVELDQIVTLVGDYVRGAVRAALDAREIERETGMTDEQWWAMNTPLLRDLIDPARYPATVKMGDAYKSGAMPPPDRARAFEFGLQRVLDGIEAFIGGRPDGRGGAA